MKTRKITNRTRTNTKATNVTNDFCFRIKNPNFDSARTGHISSELCLDDYESQ